MGMKAIDMTGRRFGRLIAVEPDPEPQIWRCVCDCGGQTRVRGARLRAGTTRSCGCLSREAASRMGKNPEYTAMQQAAVTRHGHTRGQVITPEYRLWEQAKRLCYNPKFRGYAQVGGAGISVCERWRGSFETFLADMGPRPTHKHTLTRHNLSRNFDPANCGWATQAEHGADHARGSKPLTVRGVTYPSKLAACRALGVDYAVLIGRLRKGHSVEDAFFATRSELNRKTRQARQATDRPGESK
jgi:hypothetical protein